MDPLKHAYNIEDFDNFFKFTVASLLRGRSMKVCTHLTQLVDMVCDIKGKLGRGVCRDPSLWETRGTQLTVPRDTCYHPDQHHPDSP